MTVGLFPQGPRDRLVDADLVQRLYEDMHAAPEVFQPSAAWTIDSKNAKDANSSFNLEYMMRMWIGGNSLRPATPSELADYGAFFHEIGLTPAFETLLQQAQPQAIRSFELGTLHDLAILSKFTTLGEPTRAKRLKYLEIGVGFGRLPEGVMHLSQFNVQCILVDIIPASLAWTYAYFKDKYPALNVAILGQGTDLEALDIHDILIVPTWRLEDISATLKVDIISSIASIQEMTDEQVEYYFNLFEKCTDVDSVIYFCMSRDFVYARPYPLPSHWRRRLLRPSPRSLSPDYPAEIIVRTAEDQTVANADIEQTYQKGLVTRYRVDFRTLTDTNLELRKKYKSKVTQLRDLIERQTTRTEFLLERFTQAKDLANALKAELRDARNEARTALKDARVALKDAQTALKKALADKKSDPQNKPDPE